MEWIADGFLVLDREWRVVQVNSAAAGVLDRSRDALLGRLVWEVLPALADAPHRARLLSAMAGDRPAEFEVLLAPPDRWVAVRAHPTVEGLAVSIQDVGERRRAEEALRASEARYRALIAASAQVVWTADAAGAVVGSPGWEELTGRSAESARGWGWLDAVHPDDAGPVRAAWRATLQARVPGAAEFRVLQSNGRWRWISVRVAPVLDPADGRVIEWVGACTDVDRQVRDREAAVFLSRATLALARTQSSQATLDAVASLAVAHLADLCSVDVLVEGAGGWRTERAAVAARDPDRAALARAIDREHPLPPDAALGYPLAIRTGEPLLLSDFGDAALARIARSEAHLAQLRRYDAYSGMVVPLISRDRVLGALTLMLCGPERRRPFDAGDLAAAGELARRAGVALENARLFEDAERARGAAEVAAERSRRLQSLTTALSEASTVAEVADVIVYRGMEAVGADAGSLAIVHADEGGAPREFEIVRTTGFPQAVVARHRFYPVEAGRPLSDAVRSGEPVILPDAAAWARTYPSIAFETARPGYSAFIGIPVRAHGRVLAGLSFGFAAPQSFDDGVQTFLGTLGEQCAQALERARLLEGERRAREVAERAADRTARLQAITAAFSRALTPAQVARAGVEQGAAALGASGGLVAMRTPEGDALEIVGAVGYAAPDVTPWTRIPLELAVPLTDAVRTGEPVLVVDAADRDRRYPALQPVTAHEGLLAVPLVVDDTPVGVMALSFAGPLALRTDDLDFLLAIARQCAQAVRRAALYEAAEAASRTRSNFLAVISHELRTPLNAIIGYGDLLADGITGPVSDAQVGQLRRIKASALHLLGLIDEILSFSRLEAGKETLRLEPVPVGRVLEETAAMIAPLADQRGLGVRVEGPEGAPEAPLVVVTDAIKLRQILVNLLSNAVKFTTQGEIVVAARADGDTVEFSVRDTGIGIPADQLDRIFAPFTQVESSATRRFGGTGLGLSVTRSLARLLGGEVRVESRVGEGSTFRVRIPTGG